MAALCSPHDLFGTGLCEAATTVTSAAISKRHIQDPNKIMVTIMIEGVGGRTEPKVALWIDRQRSRRNAKAIELARSIKRNGSITQTADNIL